MNKQGNTMAERAIHISSHSCSTVQLMMKEISNITDRTRFCRNKKVKHYITHCTSKFIPRDKEKLSFSKSIIKELLNSTIMKDDLQFIIKNT